MMFLQFGHFSPTQIASCGHLESVNAWWPHWGQPIDSRNFGGAVDGGVIFFLAEKAFCVSKAVSLIWAPSFFEFRI
jgi:hypothetical protein